MGKLNLRGIMFTAAAAAAISFVAAPVFAGPAGTYKRPNGKIAKVWICGGKLCASSAGVSMFKNVRRTGKGKWAGTMKHPEMGGSWAGYVTERKNSLYVQGCVKGLGFPCAGETWKKQ